MPTCSTCIVIYSHTIGGSTANYSCEDGCRTTDYYAGTIRFAGISSSCNSIVSSSSAGTFCTFYQSAASLYYSSNGSNYYAGASYGSYPSGPYPGIEYVASYFASCSDYNDNYFCCCT